MAELSSFSRLQVFKYLRCSHQHGESGVVVAVKFQLSTIRFQLHQRCMMQEQSHAQILPIYDSHEDRSRNPV